MSSNAPSQSSSTLNTASSENAQSPSLLLVANAARRSWLSELIRRIDAQLQIDAVSSVLDAVAFLTHARPQMLVLDLALDSDPAHALLLRLTRLSPSTVMLAFADAPTQLPNPTRQVWSWGDAEQVLTTSIGSLRFAGPDWLGPSAESNI